VGLKQLFQLFHGPHRPQPGAETKPQARGAASVAQELDGAAQGGEGLPLEAYGPAWCRAGRVVELPLRLRSHLKPHFSPQAEALLSSSRFVKAKNCPG
jgi:hypothetical protein